MAVNETIVTGRKFRKLIDAANKQWQRISFWHKASDCEFDDGKTAQTKVGAIDGITSDLSGESETVAASIKCVNQLNSSLSKIRTYVGSDGKLHFVNASGADTALPFSNDILFTLVADHSDLDGKDRVARFIFDNSKGIYKKIKFVNWSHNNIQIYINNTLCYGNVEYSLPQTNNVVISLVDLSRTNASVTVHLYN